MSATIWWKSGRITLRNHGIYIEVIFIAEQYVENVRYVTTKGLYKVYGLTLSKALTLSSSRINNSRWNLDIHTDDIKT